MTGRLGMRSSPRSSMTAGGGMVIKRDTGEDFFCEKSSPDISLLSLDLFHNERFEHVALFDIVKSLKSDTALKAAHDLACVVLKSLE